jgi:hypothetical protein
MSPNWYFALVPCVLALCLAWNNKYSGKRNFSYTLIVALFLSGIFALILPHNQITLVVMLAYGVVLILLLASVIPRKKKSNLN